MTRLFRREDHFTVERVNEILGVADDPIKVSRLMIAELEGALAEARTLASARLTDRNAWREQIADARFRYEKWRDKAILALDAGREDLAKAALIEKQKASDDALLLASEGALIDEIVRASEEDTTKIQFLIRGLKSRQTHLRNQMKCH